MSQGGVSDALEIGNCPVGHVHGLVEHAFGQAGCPGFTLEARVTGVPLPGAHLVTLDLDVRMFDRRGRRARDASEHGGWAFTPASAAPGHFPALVSACYSDFDVPSVRALPGWRARGPVRHWSLRPGWPRRCRRSVAGRESCPLCHLLMPAAPLATALCLNPVANFFPKKMSDP